MKEDDMSKNFNNIINSLLKKENINIEQINLLFDLFQNNKKKESYKLFVDCISCVLNVDSLDILNTTKTINLAIYTIKIT